MSKDEREEKSHLSANQALFALPEYGNTLKRSGTCLEKIECV